jgi:hypothetical protein
MVANELSMTLVGVIRAAWADGHRMKGKTGLSRLSVDCEYHWLPIGIDPYQGCCECLLIELGNDQGSAAWRAAQ